VLVTRCPSMVVSGLLGVSFGGSCRESPFWCSGHSAPRSARPVGPACGDAGDVCSGLRSSRPRFGSPILHCSSLEKSIGRVLGPVVSSLPCCSLGSPRMCRFTVVFGCFSVVSSREMLVWDVYFWGGWPALVPRGCHGAGRGRPWGMENWGS
jgi:hypothetical protein